MEVIDLLRAEEVTILKTEVDAERGSASDDADDLMDLLQARPRPAAADLPALQAMSLASALDAPTPEAQRPPCRLVPCLGGALQKGAPPAWDQAEASVAEAVDVELRVGGHRFAFRGPVARARIVGYAAPAAQGVDPEPVHVRMHAGDAKRTAGSVVLTRDGAVHTGKRVGPPSGTDVVASQDVHALLLAGRAVFVAGGVPDAMLPFPARIAKHVEGVTELRRVALALELQGRSLDRMSDADWRSVTSVLADTARDAVRPDSPAENTRVAPPTESPLQGILDLPRPPMATDAHLKRLRALALRPGVDPESVWTISAADAPSVLDVEQARERRREADSALAGADARRVLPLVENAGQADADVARRLAMHSAPHAHAIECCSGGTFAHLVDEGYSGLSVQQLLFAPNVEEQSDPAAALHGAMAFLVPFAAAVIDRLGFVIVPDAVDRMARDILDAELRVDTASAEASRGAAEELFASHGMTREDARVAASDHVALAALQAAKHNVAAAVAHAAIVHIVRQAASTGRLAIGALDRRHAHHFSTQLVSPRGSRAPSATGYAASVLTDGDPKTAATFLTSLVTRMRDALEHDEAFAHAAASFAAIKSPAGVTPAWEGYRPLADGQRGRDALPEIPDAWPWPEAPASATAAPRWPLMLSELRFATSARLLVEDAPAVGAQEHGKRAGSLSDYGVSNAIRRAVRKLDGATLALLAGRTIPAFNALMLAAPLAPRLVAPYKDCPRAMAAIISARSAAVVDARGLTAPPAACLLGDAQTLAAHVHDFLSAIHRIGGARHVTAFNCVAECAQRTVDKVAAAAIVETRREAVKEARAAVFRDLPDDMKAMYRDLKLQGIIDLQNVFDAEQEGEEEGYDLLGAGSDGEADDDDHS
jgi:hypothetical protein